MDVAEIDSDTSHTRWAHSELQKDSRQRGLPIPDEANARHHRLRKGVDAPDLATVKDFLRFYIATSRGKIVEKPTADSVNTFAEWFFAGFTPDHEHADR
jgi:hypothetical protein